MKISKIINKLVNFTSSYYWLILILAAILTVLCAPRGARLLSNIDTDLVRLLPEHYNSVKSLESLRHKYKKINSLILIIEDKDPKVAKQMVDSIAPFLSKDPTISEIETNKRGYDFFDKHKMLFIDLEDLATIRDRIDRRIQKEKLGSLYIDFEGSGDDEEFKFGDIEGKYKEKYSTGSKSKYYTNDDETIYSVYIYPVEELKNIKTYEKFYNHVRDLSQQFFEQNKNQTSNYYIHGFVRTYIEEYNTLISDLKRAGLISGLGIFLVMVLYFRRLFAVALLFVPLTINILFAFAFASLFIDSLNIVTSFLFAILGGLGIEIGIHMLSRYIEERRQKHETPEKTKHKALFDILYRTGGSALTSVTTVSATFLILMINDFRGFSEFGLIAGFGLIINFLSYMIVFPSLLILAEKIHLLNFKRKIGFESSSKKTDNAVKSRFPLPRFILACTLIFAIISLIDMQHVRFEWRFSKMKAEIPEAVVAKAKNRTTSTVVNKPAAVIIHNKEEAQAIKNVINEKIKTNPDKTVLNTFKSYYDLVPDDQYEKLAVIKQMQDLLKDETLKLVKGEHKKDLDRFKEALNDTTPIKEEEVPKGVAELFMGTDNNPSSQIAYINPLPHLELDDGKNAIQFAEEIGEIKTPVGNFYPSSDSIIFANVLKTMIANGKRAIALAFLFVFVIVFLDFRKIGVTTMVVSPILLGVIYMFGFMYLFKIKLSFYNMIVLPTVVGTSIDNSVHLYHRYKEMGKGSLMEALRSTGGAALMSSLTNILGFLGLVFTHHNGLKSIGQLAVTGMMACLLTTLIFFPALLQIMEDKSLLPSIEKIKNRITGLRYDQRKNK